MAFEQEFLAAITDKTFHYAIDAGRLTLTGDNGIVMELRKTDYASINGRGVIFWRGLPHGDEIKSLPAAKMQEGPGIFE
jgi:hypothetical protein